jgi:ankyrin repeat protein
MTETVPESDSSYLSYAVVHNRRDPTLSVYANACASNNVPLALSLLSTLETGAVTFGLNVAIPQGHIELARQLLNAGARWDAHTIRYASSSMKAVKLLVECGYDVNTGLVGGCALLP